MGVAVSCSLDDELDSNFEAVLVRTISFDDEDKKHPLRCFSFNGRDMEHNALRSYGSKRLTFGRSHSLKGRELDSLNSFKTPLSGKENVFFGRADSFSERNSGSAVDELDNKRNRSDMASRSPFLEQDNQIIQSEKYLGMPANARILAAVRLQKVYKSFRTRRQLADCAVVAEQRWWKVLDFAELKRSSISFFDIEKPESAFSRWSRARTRAAKVGKGLSKDEKARKLALQHWLEAIDPRHRYGHNLQFYYVKWLHCQSRQPFFYWLDIGDGREVNLERCPRSKLQQQCIKYLGPAERRAYEVVLEDAKFVYKRSRQVLDTSQTPKDVKWIFVLSTSKKLYVGQKKKGTFQHSSFLAGGATLSAGRLVVENGVLQAVWPHSGHYLPTEENFEAFMSFLNENNVDLTNVKRSPSEEEEEVIITKDSSIGLRPNLSEAEFSRVDELAKANMSTEENDSRIQDSYAVENLNEPSSGLAQGVDPKITKFEPHSRSLSSSDDPDEGYETAEETFIPEEEFMFPKPNLFDEDFEDEDETPVPREKIMLRIDSHKGMKSYQLGQQLSSRWTTGAGPRISCMRDYPSELQFRILEHANLSPRHGRLSSSSPKVMTPTRRDITTGSVSRFSPLAPAEVFLSKPANTLDSVTIHGSPRVMTPMRRDINIGARGISPLAPEEVVSSKQENTINSV